MLIRRFNQRGDTILEVLISVAILSLILGISFSLANRSSKANQQAVERVEAYNLGQAQLEQLKAYLSDSSHSVPAPGYFCLSYSAGSSIVTGINSKGTAVNIDNDYNSHKSDCGYGTDKRYVAMFYRANTAGDENTYKISIRWDSVRGSGADKLDFVYRINPVISASVLVRYYSSGVLV